MTAPATTLPWRCDRLQPQLQTLRPGLQVQALAAVDSTSTRLLEALRTGDAAPRLLVAEAQTAGRGRQGRRWHSAPGASLTFSLSLPYAPADWSGLSLAIGAALADAIEPPPAAPAPRLQLKWPNDLWLADGPGRWRKLGGILVETLPLDAQRALVVGIGLNVSDQPPAVALASGHAGVREIDAALDAPTLLHRVAPPLLAALERFEREGFAPFAAAYARRDLLRGRAVTTTLQGLPDGVAEGIDGQGSLRVRHAGGVALVGSGEVSVRPQAGPERGA